MTLRDDDRDKMIIEMHTILCDTNGNPGLCSQFKQHQENDAIFRATFYRFRLLVLVGAALMIGAGGLGVWKAASLLAPFLP